MKKIIILIALMISISFMGRSSINAATPSVGTQYTSYLTQTPVNSLFGTASRIQSGIGSKKKVVSSQGWLFYDTKHEDINDKMFAVYKFSNPANARIRKLLNTNIFLTQGSTYSHSVSFTQGHTYTYEVQMATELSIRYGNSLELSAGGLDYGAISLSGKATTYAEVESKISTSVTLNETYTYSTTETHSHSVTAPVSSYYVYEERGNFDVYVIQIYEAIYSVTSSKHKNWAGYTWTEYDYQVVGYKLLEQNVYYNYIDDTLTRGFFRYMLLSNGKYSYNDIKTYGITYL